MKKEKSTFDYVLTIGSEHKESRGGIGSVISLYSKYFPKFKFIASYPVEKASKKRYLVTFFSSAVFELNRRLRRDKDIKIVHMHISHGGSIYRKTILLFIAKFIYRKTVIYHSHSSQIDEYYNSTNALAKGITRFLIERSDLVVCLSSQWRDFFLSNFKPNKVVVLENIIERPCRLRTASVSNDERLKILFLGVIGARKGIFDLLEVLRDNKERLADKILLTIGGNGEVRQLQDFIEKHRLSSIVDFKGWISGAEKTSLLAQSDIYVLPSYNEGLPISILEAMSYGKAVISTSVGGIPEIVKNMENGFLISPGDKKAILDAILFFAEDHRRAKQMGAESLKLITPFYSDVVIPKIQSIYDNLLTVNYEENDG